MKSDLIAFGVFYMGAKSVLSNGLFLLSDATSMAGSAIRLHGAVFTAKLNESAANAG